MSTNSGRTRIKRIFTGARRFKRRILKQFLQDEVNDHLCRNHDNAHQERVEEQMLPIEFRGGDEVVSVSEMDKWNDQDLLREYGLEFLAESTTRKGGPLIVDFGSRRSFNDLMTKDAEDRSWAEDFKNEFMRTRIDPIDEAVNSEAAEYYRERTGMYDL